MDKQTIIAAFSIIVTVILGLWAIVIAIRYNRNVKVTYAHENAIALTDDITQNFPNLNITYYGQTISENLLAVF